MPDLEGAVRDWRDVILRLQQMTRTDQGMSIVRVDLAVVRGAPLWWTVDKQQIEPAASAAVLAKCLIERGTE